MSTERLGSSPKPDRLQRGVLCSSLNFNMSGHRVSDYYINSSVVWGDLSVNRLTFAKQSFAFEQSAFGISSVVCVNLSTVLD